MKIKETTKKLDEIRNSLESDADWWDSLPERMKNFYREQNEYVADRVKNTCHFALLGTLNETFNVEIAFAGLDKIQRTVYWCLIRLMVINFGYVKWKSKDYLSRELDYQWSTQLVCLKMIRFTKKTIKGWSN